MIGDKHIYHFDIIEYDEPDKKRKMSNTMKAMEILSYEVTSD
jgi:hypothetical protein